jgi:hypothetical protein
MISTILVVGGTAFLPGFIPRLRDTIIDALLPKTSIQGACDTLSLVQWKKRNLEPYRELYGLHNKLAIINDPKPIDGRSGSAPRWTPGLMSWVGGSLAGYVSLSHIPFSADPVEHSRRERPRSFERITIRNIQNQSLEVTITEPLSKRQAQKRR